MSTKLKPKPIIDKDCEQVLKLSKIEKDEEEEEEIERLKRVSVEWPIEAALCSSQQLSYVNGNGSVLRELRGRRDGGGC